MSFETIRVNEVYKYIGRPYTLIIDLRDKEDYLKGHIPSAVNIPYEELENYKDFFKRYNQLVFYCDRGHISLLAARDLMKYGYNMKSIHGGIRAYKGNLEKG